MAFAAVSCLIETVEDLLRFTLFASEINSIIINMEGKWPGEDFFRDSVQSAGANMLMPWFLIRGRYLFAPPPCPLKKDSNYTLRKDLYILKVRTTKIADLWRVLCCFLIFLKDFGSIYHDRQKMQYLERSLIYLAYSIEDTIEETVFDRSIISMAFNFINGLRNGFPDYAKGAAPFRNEILDLFDEKGRIHLHLQQAWREIDVIREEVKKIYDEAPIINVDMQLGQSSGIADSLQRMPSKKSEVFDMDDGFLLVLDRVIRVPSGLEMVAIDGMGGIGKATLARRVFDYPLTCHHFSIRAWVVVSLVHRVRDMLIGLLSRINQITDEIYGKSNGQLAEELYRSLKYKRFLIVLDNVWSTKAWDDIKRCFPDDNNGSRIVLTTRLKKVTDYVNPRMSPHYVNLLDMDRSWKLLQQKVFGEEPCPLELEDIGRRIARKCGGLPLVIVVIAGILCKIVRTYDCWKSIAESISSAVSSDPEQCLEILALSYNYLPNHLKACFLYMGAFPEDCEIEIQKLIRLWIAEGFLDKKLSWSSDDVKHFLFHDIDDDPFRLLEAGSISSLELEAEAYLEDLIDRNLVLVGKRSFSGKIRTCRLHDLMQDLCIREAQKEKFMYVIRSGSEADPVGIINSRRLSQHSNFWNNLHSLPQMKLVRSFLCFTLGFGTIPDTIFLQLGFRLLRVLDIMFLSFQSFPVQILKLVHLRYLAFTATYKLPNSISDLMNLQTLIIHGPWIRDEHGDGPSLLLKYWDMPWLRHLHTTVACYLRNPFIVKRDLRFTLDSHNLQSLSVIRFSSCSQEIFSLMPFLKELGIFESKEDYSTDVSCKWLSNLVHLNQLETLKCTFYAQNKSPRNSICWLLPSSLKKLTLSWSYVPWEGMNPVAMLSNLEVLKLKNHAFQGPEWTPSEEGFRCLKHLLIENLDLVHLEATRIQFPCLEHLALRSCKSLEEIPFGIAEIPTLLLIELHYCSETAEKSAKEIQEQIDGVNVDIRSPRS